MHLCFVIPPSSFLLDERVFPSLGVLKVAAVARAIGHDVSVADFSGTEGTGPLPAAHVYGVTATMPQMPAAARILRRIQDEYPLARRILGGPHPTLLHASAKRGVARAQQAFADLQPLVDVLVCGDGERAIRDALAPRPPAVIDADQPSTSLFLTAADLDTAPLPARDLLDLSSYRYHIDGYPTQSLIAQLGCPFGCNFCGGRRSPFLRRVRLRSTASVIAELRHLYLTYGTRGFMFLDDELNVNRQFSDLLQAIGDLQSSLGVDFRLRGLVKAELVTAPMARQMFDVGFRQILVGFESGAPRMLLNMNKHATIDDNTRCVEYLTSAGIAVKALMSLGHPGESPATVAQTRAWLLAVRPDDFDVTIITVYPGTPYYDDAVALDGADHHYRYTAASGDYLYLRDTDHLHDVNFYKGIPGQYQSFVWTAHLSSVDLVAARDGLEAEVRSALHIPYPTAPAARQFEHSMGCR